MTNREALKTRLGEGVTIVVSILLAFALDSWWDTHRTSQAVDEGLMSVVEELHDAEGGLVERVSAYDRVDGYLVAVLDLLDSAPSGSAIAIPDTLMAAVLYTPTIDPPTGAGSSDSWSSSINGMSDFYFFLVAYAVTLFLMAALLVPRTWDRVDDLGEYFLERKSWFYTLLFLADSFDIVDTYLKDG